VDNTIFALLPLVVVVGLAVAVIGRLRDPVPLRRARQFVERSGVPLTPSNAQTVVDGLARTVRWRVAGVLLAISIAVSVAGYQVQQAGSATVGSGTVVVLACGFLGGAVVGEVRNAARRAPGPRQATLVARRERDYVDPWAYRMPFGLALAAAPLAAVGVRVDPPYVLWLVAAVLVPWLTARWATRAILERPRPQSDDDAVLAADDGLRSRALHAIGGSVVLVSSWSVVSLALVLATDWSGTDSAWPLVYVIALLVTARVAWLLAVRPFPVRQSEPAGPVVPRSVAS
jgi:hypothetical protein